MVTLLIIALASAGVALVLVARGATLPRMRAEDSLGQIEAYGYRQTDAPAEHAERQALMPVLAARIGARLGGQGAEGRQAEARKLLLTAGIWDMTPMTLIGYRVLTAVLAGVICAWSFSSAGFGPLWAVVSMAYGGYVGWRLPAIMLASRGRRRLERIEIELPELIDLLVVTLEAGLGFTAAMQRSAERLRGPLGKEIRFVLREHNLGLTMEQALQNMLERCDAPSVRAFVRAVAQSESLGVSIGQIMRELAGDIRTRRRQIIEEKAQKAPIKILFPLAFLILPAMFVVVLFPSLYRIAETIGGA
jgi:tight adherence protein C